MQYRNTIEAISLQLHEIQKSIAYWELEEDIRNIDIDTSLAKLRDVYDLLLSIKTDNNFPATGTNIPETTPLETEKPSPELIDNPTEEKEIEIELSVDPEPPIKEEKTVEKSTEPANNFSSLGEKYSKTRPTLNEELSSHVNSEDLAKHLKNRPITNLSAAIGLNEKFELINNLFHGNKESYETTIETLNMATNFNEAYNYLSGKLNWDMSNPLVQRLLDLIRRKLIVKKNE